MLDKFHMPLSFSLTGHRKPWSAGRWLGLKPKGGLTTARARYSGLPSHFLTL